DPPPPARGSAARLRDLPEEARRRVQGPVEALADPRSRSGHAQREHVWGGAATRWHHAGAQPRPEEGPPARRLGPARVAVRHRGHAGPRTAGLLRPEALDPLRGGP